MNKMQKRALVVGVAAACTWLGGAAQAAGNHTVTVNASVQGKCTFNSGSSTMGTITVDPAATTTVNGSQTVLFRCTKNTTSTMAVTATSTGGGASGNLLSGTESLAYSFSASGTAQGGTGLGAGQDKTLTVGVTIDQSNAASLPAGTYTDTIAISVTP